MFVVQNEGDAGIMSFRRPVEPLSLAPQTGFVRTNSNGEVPSQTNSSSNNSNTRSYPCGRERGFIEKLLVGSLFSIVADVM